MGFLPLEVIKVRSADKVGALSLIVRSGFVLTIRA